MNTEANDEFNEGLGDLVDKLYKIRSIEHSDMPMAKKHKKASVLIEEVLLDLYDRHDYVTYRPLWEELHDRMVYYYDYLNVMNMKTRMPIFRMTLHNEAIVWWLRLKSEGRLHGPLVHFDTHDDMGLPSSSEGLLNSRGCIDSKGIEKGACGMIYWPVTCLLIAKGVDKVIWGMPKWVYDDDAGFDQVLVCKKKEFSYLRGKDQPKDRFILTGDIEIVDSGELLDSGYLFHHPLRLERLHVDTLSSWKRLGRLIKPSGKFILDIDLDFFVTNGDKTNLQEYRRSFPDIESEGRVHGLPGMRTPRSAYVDKESRHMILALKKEEDLIRRRIESFLLGLKKLRDEGMIPCCINISDSCTSLLSGNRERAVFTNQYTPKYFVPMIHALLTSGFSELYD